MTPGTRTVGLPAACGPQDITALLRTPTPVRRTPINPVVIVDSTTPVRPNLAALHTASEARHTASTKVECRIADAKLKITIEAPGQLTRFSGPGRHGR